MGFDGNFDSGMNTLLDINTNVAITSVECYTANEK